MEVFEIVASHVDNDSNGGAIGVLEIDVINNDGVVTYKWFKDNEPYLLLPSASPKKLTNLSKGNYTVIVTDSKTCSATLSDPIIITEPEPLDIQDSSFSTISCKDRADGRISITVTGGIAPYVFEWTMIEDASFTTSDSAEINNLGPGQYYAIINDSSGSMDAMITSDVFEITEPDALDIIIENATSVICEGDSTGAIDISVTGGTPPYQILWDSGSTSEDQNNLSIGTYTVLVEDSNTCTVDLEVTVENVPDQLSISNQIISQVSEYEGSDGGIQLEVRGGTPPYSYVWTKDTDINFSKNSKDIDNLAADTYYISITDANNCRIEKEYEITQPDIVENTITELICVGDCTSTIEVIVNKGNGNFTYTWDTGATTNTISDLCAGLYTVTIGGFGNRDLTRTYEIINPEPVQVDLGEDQYICLGQTATISAAINDIAASYVWSADTGFSSTEKEISVDQAGLYTVTVTNSRGCVGSSEIQVREVDAEIGAEFLYTSQVFTNEEFIIIDVTYPVPDTIEWILPEEATVINKDQDLVELSFDTPGEYDITLTSMVGNCSDIYTQKVLVFDRETTDAINEVNRAEIRGIKDFTVFPNPSNGKFSVNVELKEVKGIKIKIFGMASNTLLAQSEETGSNTYEVAFDLSATPGLYAILLETPYGSALRKVIIKG